MKEGKGMKKIIIVTLMLTLCVTGCSGSSTVTETTATIAETESETQDKLFKCDATEIARRLYNKGIKISDIVEYDSTTDPDNQLGKSNEYTSKVKFTDVNNKCDVILEVYKSEEDADNNITKYSNSNYIFEHKVFTRKASNVILKYDMSAPSTFSDIYLAVLNNIEKSTGHVSSNIQVLKPGEEPQSDATGKSTTTTAAVSTEYKNALKKAQSYSDSQHLSKSKLYEQLTSQYGEKFTDDAAQYAIDNVNADYKANALAKAKSYQSSQNMSSSRIYDQLTSDYGEMFTAEEAQYAIDNLN